MLAEERELLERRAPQPAGEPHERELRHSKRLSGLADSLLADNAKGPHWLAEERIATLVVDALFYHDRRLYLLWAFAVMPNQVQVLLQPLDRGAQLGPETGQAVDRGEGRAADYVPSRRIAQSPKGYTAREANRLLGRTGRPFWQEKSYDHWVRNEGELARIVTYIEGDPVRCGLAEVPEAWRWSSAWERTSGRLQGPAWVEP